MRKLISLVIAAFTAPDARGPHFNPKSRIQNPQSVKPANRSPRVTPDRPRALGVLVSASCALANSASAQDSSPPSPLSLAAATVSSRVVKIYAAGIGTVKSYGSGVAVSADGRIVTVQSAMLEDPNLRVVLADGRRYPATVVARDEIRQIAELKIEAENLPHFSIASSRHLLPGDWVIAAANSFKVADGPEAVSVAYGVLSERTELTARLRTQDFPYHGPVLLTDVIVSSPGSAGGALCDIDGRLVGVIGRAVTSTRTNTFANYALPVEEVAAFLNRQPSAEANFANGRDAGSRELGSEAASKPARTLAGDFGIRLLDVGGRTRPAYVERVRNASPAGKAGLRADDLILSINNQPVATCSDAETAFLRSDRRKPIIIVLKRREEVQTIEVNLSETRP